MFVDRKRLPLMSSAGDTGAVSIIRKNDAIADIYARHLKSGVRLVPSFAAKLGGIREDLAQSLKRSGLIDCPARVERDWSAAPATFGAHRGPRLVVIYCCKQRAKRRRRDAVRPLVLQSN